MNEHCDDIADLDQSNSPVDFHHMNRSQVRIRNECWHLFQLYSRIILERCIIVTRVESFQPTVPYVETELQENTMEQLLATAAKDFFEGVLERSMHTAVGFLATAQWTRIRGTSAATVA